MEYIQHIFTAKGPVQVTASEEGITAIEFRETPSAESPNPLTQEACTQLSAYFSGKLRQFDLPLAAQGTAFQIKVWNTLRQVGYGETASYLDIAAAIGNPKSVRAVGSANGRNPIAIVVPCHRIIGSNRTLTGYAGGLERKQFLLNLEGAQGVLWQ